MALGELLGTEGVQKGCRRQETQARWRRVQGRDDATLSEASPAPVRGPRNACGPWHRLVNTSSRRDTITDIVPLAVGRASPRSSHRHAEELGYIQKALGVHRRGCAGLGGGVTVMESANPHSAGCVQGRLPMVQTEREGQTQEAAA